MVVLGDLIFLNQKTFKIRENFIFFFNKKAIIVTREEERKALNALYVVYIQGYIIS